MRCPFSLVATSLLLSGVPAVAQSDVTDGPVRIPEAIQKDARLKAPVTLVLQDEPLGQALSRIGASVRVELRATRDTADDRITLALKDRPAAEVLARIAAHFDFDWLTNGKRYELAQSIASKRREEALRDADQTQHLADIHARMLQVAALGNQTPEQLQARQEELNALARDPQRPEPERRTARGQSEAIRDRLRPGAVAGVALYQRLTPAQLQQLRSGAALRLSSRDGTLAANLADQIHQSALQRGNFGGTSMSRTLRFSTTPGGAAPPLPQSLPAPEPAESLPVLRADATIQLSESGPGRLRTPDGGRAPRPQLFFTLTSVRGRENEQRSTPVIWSPMLGGSGLEEEFTPTQTGDPELLREVDLGYKPGPVPPSPGSALMRLVPFGPGGAAAGTVRVSEVVEKLHRATGLEVLGDSFVRARVRTGMLGGKKRVVEVLDAIARSGRYMWRKDAGLLSLRSREWFRDRPASVPARIVTPWKQKVAAQGAPTLDDLADLAVNLTDPQLQGMEQYWGLYLEGADIPAPGIASSLYTQRHHLRFWGALNQGQRQAAHRGEILAAARMLAPQRRAFAVAFAAPVSEIIPPADLAGSSGQATPQQLAAGGFSLRRSEMQQMMFSMPGGAGGEARAGIMIFADQNRTQGGGPRRPGQPGAPVPPGLPGAPAPNRAFPLPQLEGPDGVRFTPAGTPTTLDSFSFNYHLDGQQQPAKSAQIQVPRPKPPVEKPAK